MSEQITLRSYRLAFEVERRLHRIDRFRVPVPYGIPLRGIAYGVVALMAVLWCRAVPVLGAGDTSSGTTSVVLPASLAAGTYFLFAKADADSAVTESQEANNIAVRSIQIGGDLVVSAFTAPSRGAGGGGGC